MQRAIDGDPVRYQIAAIGKDRRGDSSSGYQRAATLNRYRAAGGYRPGIVEFALDIDRAIRIKVAFILDIVIGADRLAGMNRMRRVNRVPWLFGYESNHKN